MLTEGFPRKACVWVLGNHPPRRCGIATFTSDLADAIEANGTPCKVAAMDDGTGIAYTGRVELTIAQDDLASYIEAADQINRSRASAVFIQHEFGIFGGEEGSHIVTLLRFLEVPVVTTLHTVLDKPNNAQRSVTEEILSRSERVVVMSHKAKQILRRCYGQDDNVVVIPHGVPSCPAKGRSMAKSELGWSDRQVILTFGLLSPDKGIETMIRAMSHVKEEHPDAMYVVAGQTHPHIRRSQGEAYRESLEALCVELGLGDSVRFVNRFTELDELCTMLTACDLYVTPYLKMEQITSGTLSYAVGMGRCVVSTPYWHAEELLSQGPGRLVPPGDVQGFARAIGELLRDDEARHLHEAEAGRIGKAVRWPRIGGEYLRLVADIWRPMQLPFQPASSPSVRSAHVDVTEHLLRLTDDTGLYQHATYDLPNRNEGYCTDDNCRALSVLWSAPKGAFDHATRERLERVYLGFVAHAWNPHTRAFRNFMDFDRKWLEAVGSPDCQARTLIALAQGSRVAESESRRKFCEELYLEAWPSVISFEYPRHYAQVLKAASLWVRDLPASPNIRRAGDEIAARLVQDLDRHTGEGWSWYEDQLTYDNARLPEALLLWARITQDRETESRALDSLAWLCEVQTRDGYFAPIGNQGFWHRQGKRPLFDQQPLESWATIDACLAAYAATQAPEWLDRAHMAFNWFYGRNTLGALMVDPETGACSDGLERHGPSSNQGAESCLAFLGSLFAMETITAAPSMSVSKPAML